MASVLIAATVVTSYNNVLKDQLLTVHQSAQRGNLVLGHNITQTSHKRLKFRLSMDIQTSVKGLGQGQLWVKNKNLSFYSVWARTKETTALILQCTVCNI